MSNTPLKERRASCFVRKHNESLELLSLSFRCFAGSANKEFRQFKSKDFMSDERKIENEIVIYSDYIEKQIAFNQIELQMQVSGD